MPRRLHFLASAEPACIRQAGPQVGQLARQASKVPTGNLKLARRTFRFAPLTTPARRGAFIHPRTTQAARRVQDRTS